MFRKFLAATILLVTTAAAACGSPSVSSPNAISPTPSPIGSATPTPTPVTGAGHIRLMSANLSSGNGQNWNPGQGARILQGTHPDIVMIQEFNYGTNSDADIRAFVDSTFGSGYFVARETGAQIPNGVVSRFPILASGTWTDSQVSNRGFEWAQIDIPGNTDLWAISVHLLTTSGTARNAEAQEIVSKIQALVPAGAHVVVGGDFNSGTRTEGCVTTLSAVVSTAGPFPADRNGNDNTSAARSVPHDWVLVDSALQALESPTVIGANSFAHGLVADTRVYDPIADLAPALAADSGASGMQHMGVVRDFEIP